MHRTCLLLFALVFHLAAVAQIATVHPLQNSIGVEVLLPADYDTDETTHCRIRYKKATDNEWKETLDASRVVVEGVPQFRGSLFLLEEGTAYELQVTLLDSVPVISVQNFAVQTVTTRAPVAFSPGSNLKWVSPDGSGNFYTEAQPGNIGALLSSGGVGCGTTVMIKDGVYTDVNLALTISADCDTNTPIQFLAAPGAHPVFDGGYAAPLTWTQHPSDAKLYTASLPAGTDFTNLCLLNGHALYPYPSLSANLLFGNYNLLDLNLGADGFIRDNSTIRLKTQAGTDPNTVSVVLSKAFRFLTVYGNNRQAHLVFKGLTIRNIAKSNLSGTVSYTAIAFDLRNLHHVSFDDCHFEYNNSNILLSGLCSEVLVQNSSFKQENGRWSHAMIKKSVLESFLAPTSMGRAGETAAIQLTEGKHIVVRNNRFEGINSGLVGNFNAGLVEEADVYNNVFVDNFDAIESDGNWCNLRVWGNEFIRPMAAFSIAPPKTGPRYFYRNTIHHLKGRRNEQDDPYFIGCAPVTTYFSQAIGLKTNSGSLTTENPSDLYFINNTFHSEDTLGFGYTLWAGEWKNIYWINNIFYAVNNHLGYFQGFLNQSNFQMSSVRDNYYTADLSQPLFVIKEIHGQYTCHDVYDVQQIEDQLSAVTGSERISFVQPFNENPEFITTTEGGFELSATSPMINAGKVVPGFYDYVGTTPDLGAKESAIVDAVAGEPEKGSFRVFPNPAHERLFVVLDDAEAPLPYTLLNVAGQVLQTGEWQSGKPIDIGHLASGIYWLRVEGRFCKFVKQ